MKKKKTLIVGLLITALLLGAAAVYWFVVRGSSNNDDTSEVVTASDEIKVEDLNLYLSEQEDYAKFYEFYSAGTELESKLNPDDNNGVSPKYIIFAANNTAFEDNDVSGFEELSEAFTADFRQYYSAVFSPDVNGVFPDLGLSDGQRISTIGGKVLLVAKRGKKLVVIDMKGREAEIDSKYAVDPNGNRVYFINSLLLLQ